MDLAQLRAIFIISSSAIDIVGLILIGIVIWSIYREAKPILQAARTMTAFIAEGVVRPLFQLVNNVSGIEIENQTG